MQMQLKQIIEESKNVVFLEELVFLQKVAFQILDRKTAFIMLGKSMVIRQSKC